MLLRVFINPVRRKNLRELGDIKALLLADRAQRRQSEGVTISGGDDEAGEGTNNPGVTTRAPKLLTSSDDRSSNRSPDPYSDQPLGSQSWSPSQLGTSADPGQDSATMGSAEKEDGGKESEVSPLSTLTRREVQVLDLLTEGHTNRCVFGFFGMYRASHMFFSIDCVSKTDFRQSTFSQWGELRTHACY